MSGVGFARVFVSLLSLGWVAHAALAQGTSAPARIARVERGLLPPVVTDATVPMRLADRMRRYQVPAVSVAVVEDGALVWAQAWGLAQRGHAERVHPQTLFQAASISKPVTALGAFRLIDQGRLTLDGDVNAALTSWQVPPGAQSPEHPVTLRGLLSHTAGLTVAGFPGYVPGTPVPTLLQILDGLPPANTPAVRVDKAPGGDFRYAGGGFVLLQTLMQDVSGEAFAPWMQREVLARAGMGHSQFGALPDAPLSVAAAGHRAGKVIPGRRATHPELAAAGLWTTPTDLAQLSIALQQALAGVSGGVVSPQHIMAALNAPTGTMGLGFNVEGAAGQLRYGHDGSNEGFQSRWLFDGRRAVIVMANANGAMPLMNEIIRAVAAEHGWTGLQARRFVPAELRAAMDRTPLFVRGSFNDWGTNTPLRPAAPGRFEADLQLPVGPLRFKLASADWDTIDLGADPADGAGPGRLSLGGADIERTVAQAGRYRLQIDARQPAALRYFLKALP